MKKTADLPVRKRLAPADLKIAPHALFNDRWLLLAVGDFAARQYNCMTVSWGSIGTIWNRPFVQVVVRPQRYTFAFMEKFGTFTLSAFRPAYRHALQILGSKSGRQGNKIAEAGLTPEPSIEVAAPSFAEADLTIECRKMYWQDITPKGFLLPALQENYPDNDYHRAYFGEIAAVHATREYA
jgi:flavin reductase (DIM6/NTAB) family NADH-FMN oxidoreductase RutF